MSLYQQQPNTTFRHTAKITLKRVSRVYSSFGPVTELNRGYRTAD